MKVVVIQRSCGTGVHAAGGLLNASGPPGKAVLANRPAYPPAWHVAQNLTCHKV
jgi:hypothetical protein